MVTGCLILESLRLGARIEVDDLVVTSIRRVHSDGAAGGQPTVWSLLDVAVPDHAADGLFTELSAALEPEGLWYADFAVGQEHVVVYPGRVFRYRLGDAAGLAEAMAHGRALGIPEAQLDWDTETARDTPGDGQAADPAPPEAGTTSSPGSAGNSS